MKIAGLEISVPIDQRVIDAHAQNQDTDSGNPDADYGYWLVHDVVRSLPLQRDVERDSTTVECYPVNHVERPNLLLVKP